MKNIPYIDILLFHDGLSNVPDIKKIFLSDFNHIYNYDKCKKKILQIKEIFIVYLKIFTFNAIVVNPCWLHIWHCNKDCPRDILLVATLISVTSDDKLRVFDWVLKFCDVSRNSSLCTLSIYSFSICPSKIIL